MMIIQCSAALNLKQGTTVSSNDYGFNGFSRKSQLLMEFNESYFNHERFSIFHRNGGFSSLWLGSSEMSSYAANSSFKAKVLDREEGFPLPPIQTLQKFPMQEISAKVVMVRFDSSILLNQKLGQFSSITSNAFFTIRYLCEAGAKVVLISSWNVKSDSKILSEAAVADILTSALQLKVVYGGSKLKNKGAALRVLASRCDGMVFVGMMALQIMHAMGMSVPLFLVEREGAKEALEIVKYAEYRSIPILLPSDFLCRNNRLHMKMQTFPAQGILDGWELVDLGQNSFSEIATFLSQCKKIVWIGPVKVRQSDQHSDGASKLTLILDEFGQNGCHITVIGHLACEAVLKASKSTPEYSMIEHASIVWEYLNGRNLPGLLALDRAYPYEIAWNMIYANATQSLAVDIGSGNGLFLMGMANKRKDLNFLGLEMNEKLVQRCLESADQPGPKNLHFIATNATSSFRTIVSSYPGRLVLVSIQCPNPDFNEPDHRWRMVQRSLVEAIADQLAPGGQVFLQSDIEAVATRMSNQFLNQGKNKLAIAYDEEDSTVGPGGWLKENPFGIRSDWERHVLARGAPMYRLMLYKR
ncbi:uncharacterized protein LOC130827599 isoform X4 [Amaranthus tricolor]|uniref:uncharacterized protein LOC130827599 isoform X4 n=1 Tax=Amaranthus tricolor TaxID=29722 RepID=UPI00258BDCB2|nr:uncharacterized protein LOC130827599 isoform X4 [Amaranthus tricolor]